MPDKHEFIVNYSTDIFHSYERYNLQCQVKGHEVCDHLPYLIKFLSLLAHHPGDT